MNSALDSETEVLGAILTRAKEWDKIKDYLAPDDFSHIPFQWLWQACHQLAENGITPDIVSAADQLQRMGQLDDFTTTSNAHSGATAIAWLTDNKANTKNAESHAAIIKDYSLKRKLATLGQSIATAALNGHRADEVIITAQTGLQVIESLRGSKSEMLDNKSILTSFYDDVVSASKGEIVAYSTGFKDIDYLMDGGSRGGQFIIPAGRPGTGKSAFMLNLMNNDIENNMRPAFFGIEMSPGENMKRLVSSKTKIPLSLIKTGKLDADQWAQIGEEMGYYENKQFWMLDVPTLTIPTLYNHVRNLVGMDCKVIYIDYIQLIQVSKKSDNRVAEVSYITRELKALARTFNIPVYAAAQLNRAVEARKSQEPVLSDLRESGSLEQDADIIIFLWRENEDTNTVNGKVGKNRDGKVGKFELLFTPHTVTFHGATTVKLN